MRSSELYCLIETPKGSFVAQRAPVDRWLPSPVDCCYFPDTLDGAGRPLEALVCATGPGAPGSRVSVKPIGLMRVHARGAFGDAVVCVAAEDPVWEAVEDPQGLPVELRAEMERFVTARHNQGDAAATVSWCDREHALATIDAAAARWAGTVNGHG
ncbi:MAG TPA: inorganic diphosphatase [Solirubrobacteraceae bacterium]|nr:inorganic diphosphatase [Solirubrobacteraceae bacterium]